MSASSTSRRMPPLPVSAKNRPAAVGGSSPEPVQFERQGYFCRDRDSAVGRPVFNRTVGLRDTWAKVSGRGAGGTKGPRANAG